MVYSRSMLTAVIAVGAASSALAAPVSSLPVSREVMSGGPFPPRGDPANLLVHPAAREFDVVIDHGRAHEYVKVDEELKFNSDRSVGLERRQDSENRLDPSPATAPDTFKPPTPTTQSHGGTKAKLKSMMNKVTQHPKFISMMQNPKVLQLMQHPNIAPYANRLGLNGGEPAKNAAAVPTPPAENPVSPIASVAPQIPPLNFDRREVADPTPSDSNSFSPSPYAKSVRLARSFLAPRKDGGSQSGTSGPPSGNTGIPPTSHQTSSAHGAQSVPHVPEGMSSDSWKNDPWYPPEANEHPWLGNLRLVSGPHPASNAGPSGAPPPPGTGSNMPPPTRRAERHQEAKYDPTNTFCRPGTLCGRSDNPEFEQWFMDLEGKGKMASVYLQTSTWAGFLKTSVGQRVQQKGQEFEEYVLERMQKKWGPPLRSDPPLTSEDFPETFAKMERTTKLIDTYLHARTWSAFWESKIGQEVTGKGSLFKAFVQAQMESKWGPPFDHHSSHQS
ncbi:hypothetical protein F5051DRAFT_454901 [Lentinula edodes]|nr:hypothetical protein F5051DRAFT_454901 [Lentinula edodes]